MEDQAAALEVFTAFTECAAVETDVLALSRAAYAVMDRHFDQYSSAYYKIRDGLWKGLTWTDEMTPQQTEMICAGLPLDLPSFAQALETQLPGFIDGWDAARAQVKHTDVFGPVYIYPLVIAQEVRGIFTVGLRVGEHWQDRDRGLMRALGRSLTLALERGEGIRQQAERNAELRVAVDELEAFAYSVSHDLRTPVRHIKGFNALLRSQITDSLDLKTGHYLSVIDDAASRMNTLIDAMLDLSRTTRQPLRLEEIDLATLVTSVQVELTPEQAERTLKWQVGPLPMVNGDRHLLRQVMLNLLSNALKYSRPCPQTIIEVWTEEQPGEWAILIRDNGVGFDPRYASRLFGVFQRLHHENESEGTGVGLANVWRIVSRHGGRVAAQTLGIGEGATFSFTLPRGR